MSVPCGEVIVMQKDDVSQSEYAGNPRATPVSVKTGCADFVIMWRVQSRPLWACLTPIIMHIRIMIIDDTCKVHFDISNASS